MKFLVIENNVPGVLTFDQKDTYQLYNRYQYKIATTEGKEKFMAFLTSGTGVYANLINTDTGLWITIVKIKP